MKTHFLIQFITLSLATAVFAQSTNSLTPEEEIQRKISLAPWKSMSLEQLALPENADELAELKSAGEDIYADHPRWVLIELNDPETIESCLQVLRSGTADLRLRVYNQFTLANNPRIIPHLWEFLYKDEEQKYTRENGAMVQENASLVALMIKEIILRSSEFSPEMKVWAKSLAWDGPPIILPLREWSNLNKEALENGDFKSVVPLPLSNQSATKKN